MSNPSPEKIAREAAAKECQLQYDSPRIKANGGVPLPQGYFVQELLTAQLSALRSASLADKAEIAELEDRINGYKEGLEPAYHDIDQENNLLRAENQRLREAAGATILGKNIRDYLMYQFPIMIGHIPLKVWLTNLSAAISDSTPSEQREEKI